MQFGWRKGGGEGGGGGRGKVTRGRECVCMCGCIEDPDRRGTRSRKDKRESEKA